MSLAESVSDHAVRVSATVQTNPPRIVLSWAADATAVEWDVARKGRDEADWGPATTLGGSATNYTDTNAIVGGAYEYIVLKITSTYFGLGYIYVGIEAPLAESRGKAVLLVDNTQASSLAAELARLQQDLAGDGWTVLRHDVARSDSVTNIKALLLADYNVDPTNVRAVFLFGHVPVPYSGDSGPDGHTEHIGAWPADAYYGDMTGSWTDTEINSTTAADARNRNVPGDGKFDQTLLPATVALQVGRVDLSNLPAFPQSEGELLRRYLNKDHHFRHKVTTVERRGLIDDHLGLYQGEAFAANGYRAFAPFFGASNTVTGDWLPTLGAQAFLWAYGCGDGTPYSSAGGIATTSQLATNDPRVVFTMLFGSYFGDWDTPNNLLRAQLATPGYTLSSVWAGRPYWMFHHMGLGETIGFSTRVTQNNYALYLANLYYNRVHIGLMGDPTLRMHVVAPPVGLTVATNGGGGMDLRWNASADTVVGYHVYSAPTAGGPFTRLNSVLLTSTNYTDSFGATNIYMVRAVKLEVSGSGSYWNASQGIFQSPDGSFGTPTVALHQPTNNTIAVAPATVSLEANTTDFANRVTKVEFYAGTLKIGEDSTAPYSLAWSNPSAGRYELTARAVYGGGLAVTSGVVSVRVDSSLCATGAVWKYLDDGSDQGEAWRGTNFNDSSWASGPAKLGYSNSPATAVSFGSNPSNKYVTTYFRRALVVQNPAIFTNLTIGLLRDDGAIVYLNSNEVFRGNMPGGSVGYRTLASTSVSGAAETTFYSTAVSPTLLVSGTNVLAVEVHLAASNSPALGFDLFLNGAVRPVLTISAQDTNKVFGAPLPDFTAVYSGFTNGDTPASLDTPPVLTTSATASSPVGSYPIQGSGAVDPHYAISYVDGTLSILPAATTGLVTSSTNPSSVGQPVTFTLTLEAVAPGAGTPTGTVQFRMDGTNAGAPITLSGSSALFSTTNLGLGNHTVTAEYAGDGNFTGTTNALATPQVVVSANAPPVTGPDTLERRLPNGAKVLILTLLSNDLDPESDLITFLGVSATSAHGGAVVTNENWVFYSPAAGFTNTDTFTYTITDGHNAPVTGTVTVVIGGNGDWPPNLLALSLGDGSYQVIGDGLPGCTYRIEFTDSLENPVWQTLGSATADQFGVFTVTDTPGTPQRFYRSVYP